MRPPPSPAVVVSALADDSRLPLSWSAVLFPATGEAWLWRGAGTGLLMSGVVKLLVSVAGVGVWDDVLDVDLSFLA
jgi:hypothetical protein